MCLVLDSNILHNVFDVNSKDHSSFKPVLNWLYKNKRTCLVYGGTKYKSELKRNSKYLSYISELKRNKKVKEVKDRLVDIEEKRVKDYVNSEQFDDPHIVAIFRVSHCKVLVSNDKRADKYLKMKSLYETGRKPSIYRNENHEHLLNEDNIVNIKNVES